MRPKAAPKIAYVPRGQVQLASLVKQSIPDLGISTAASNDSRAPKAGGGCACSTRDGGAPMLPAGLAALTALLAEARRRRRQAR
jgi:MYXO-CTERM domain-containing protein